MKIGKYSFGVGDRFAHEGINQLKALIEAEERFGVRFVPVWNKSNREHQIVGTEPMETRLEADAAVNALPSPEEVAKWDTDTYARTLRHNQADPLYNPSFRQLIHVSYKIAAELADEFLPALEKHTEVIGSQITANLCDRHIKRLFSE